MDKTPPTKTSIFQTRLSGLISANYMWPLATIVIIMLSQNDSKFQDLGTE